MKKFLLVTLAFVSTFNLVSAQDKIVEFSTSHAEVGMGATKMPIQFSLYADSLVMNYQDKNTIKMLRKAGQPSSMVFSHPFEKRQNGSTVWYVFEDPQNKIYVILGDVPSVKIQAADPFSGAVTEQLYYNLK